MAGMISDVLSKWIAGFSEFSCCLGRNTSLRCNCHLCYRYNHYRWPQPTSSLFSQRYPYYHKYRPCYLPYCTYKSYKSLASLLDSDDLLLPSKSSKTSMAKLMDSDLLESSQIEEIEDDLTKRKSSTKREEWLKTSTSKNGANIDDPEDAREGSTKDAGHSSKSEKQAENSLKKEESAADFYDQE